MKAVIPAAGRGSRLGALTDDQPKGLVEIAGRPLLAYVFDRAIEAGAEELVVVIGYEGAQIVDRFGDSFCETPITYVHQRERLGLAHAVLQAEPHVTGAFLVVNGDNVFIDSLQPAVAALEDDGVDGVIAVEDVSRNTASRTGVVELANETVARIIEKPTDPPSTLVTTGCYVLPEDAFEACKLVQPSADGEYQLSEAVSLLAHAGYTIATARVGDRVNVNHPADLDQAEALLQE
ncbi:nucleotidyltransferase family protein [Halorubrum sp. AD140]|uniref:nucleotidyltransferase family protein n=1 Tax=Halorubrum sp. AD140 TaxID=3050073 RepID=UPI002ACC4865|nr:nucleotidyltransferase family protein [Halorubrum sp. AD140]MDZ5810505.1 nucleotidyltransferase family protein [Halorubrum sp. AD140]